MNLFHERFWISYARKIRRNFTAGMNLNSRYIKNITEGAHLMKFYKPVYSPTT
jgi:hypothetical protein